jgi:hypothetical protein
VSARPPQGDVRTGTHPGAAITTSPLAATLLPCCRRSIARGEHRRGHDDNTNASARTQCCYLICA